MGKIRGHGTPRTPKFIHSPHAPRHGALDQMHEAVDRTAARRAVVKKAISRLGLTLPLTREQKIRIVEITGLRLSSVTDTCRALRTEAPDAKA